MAEKPRDSKSADRMARGGEILLASSRSKDKELKGRADKLIAILKQLRKMALLEVKLGINPKKSARGLAVLTQRDILATVGATGRIPKKGWGSMLMPDFWKTIREIEGFSSARIKNLEKQKVVKKPKPKPKKPPPKKTRRGKK